MPNLIYFSGMPLLDNQERLSKKISGLTDFIKIQKYFMLNVGIIDRSNTIQNPFNSVITNPLPRFDTNFNLSYEESVMLRMSEIDKIYQSRHKKFRLFYSGGIDSTTILSGFIKYFGVSKTSKILEICCTPDSINENPWVWDRYILKENFKIKSSLDHPRMWEDNVITIMGEGNDHIFGCLNGPWNRFAGEDNLYPSVDIDLIIKFLLWSNKTSTIDDAEFTASEFIKLVDIAPFPVDNMYLFIWWYKFLLEWEGIMIRVLAQSTSVTASVENLLQFYNTEDFQQWSMHFHRNHPTEFAESTNYKQECKKFILKTLDVPEYAAKCKFTSWPRVHSLIPSGVIIDENFKIHRNADDFLNFI